MTGGITFAASTAAHSECSSGLGQLGQDLSGQYRTKCSLVEIGWAGGGLGALAGTAMIIAGATNPDRRRRPGPPPPGWYPDPQDPRWLRWWNGQGWTQHTHRAAP